MKSVLRIALVATPDQVARLKALQQSFADLCNTLAPIARDTRCWNRVALHHMVYRRLREQFPQIGSQMVCNAIYSVSRACRIVYQSPKSPFNIARNGRAALPLLHFAPNAQVYFDRHTLSIKGRRLSMYTLDGRIRFEIALSADDEKRFHEQKLLEIVLASKQDAFSLTFVFDDGAGGAEQRATDDQKVPGGPESNELPGGLPEHVKVLPEPELKSAPEFKSEPEPVSAGDRA